MENKICKVCLINKELNLYRKNRTGTFGPTCKSCYRDTWKLKNPNYQKNYDKSRSKDVECKRNKKWRMENSDARKERFDERMKNDVIFNITIKTRWCIKSSFRDGYTKKSKTQEILGCSYEEFKIHIESQFIEGMTWKNHGEWHLDHKIPVSWGKTEDEIIKLNHYTNFQPLWACDNLSKKNRFSN